MSQDMGNECRETWETLGGVSKARLIITAVVEGRSQADVARDYDVSKSWVSKLVARDRTDGEAAFEPRSRRPRSIPSRTDDATVELVCDLCRTLTDQGLEAGADTIAWHLTHHHGLELSRATIDRIVRRAEVPLHEIVMDCRSRELLC